MNEIDKNKLKFQLMVFLKQNIGIIVGSLMIAVVLALNNQMEMYHLARQDYSIAPSVFLSLAIMLGMANTILSTVYKYTSAYFISLGYTRKKYYLGILIFSSVLSFIYSSITVVTFMINLMKPKTFIKTSTIYYMGFYFENLDIYFFFKIFILTFIIFMLILSLANFISITTFSHKSAVIVINILIGGLLLFINYKSIYGWKIVNFILQFNKSYMITCSFYILAFSLLFTLGKLVFMKIDID